jgi:hypothetical protein
VEQLEAALVEALEQFGVYPDIQTDNYGQIVVYTGLMESGDELVPWEEQEDE